MSRREVGQARGVEEGLEQWAHRGAKVGLALERALWVPRPERGPGLEWTAWAPGLERALERSLCAPWPERALEWTAWAPGTERTAWAPGTERTLERTPSAPGLEQTLERSLCAPGLEWALERTAWTLERSLCAPGMEWALERTLMAPGTERALERTLSAPGTERALERTLSAPGTERALERTLSASGLERALQLTPPWRLSRLNSEPGWCSPPATLLGPSKASGIWRARPGLPRRRPWGRYSPSPTDERLPRSAWCTPQFSRLPDGYWRASPLDPSLLANSLLSPLLADPFCQMGGDRQSTWEHMAPTNNKPCAQHTETSGGQPGHTSRTVTYPRSHAKISLIVIIVNLPHNHSLCEKQQMLLVFNFLQCSFHLVSVGKCIC